MSRISTRLRCGIIGSILILSCTLGSQLLRSSDVERSDDPRLRWETERAMWDKQRGTWDTEPSRYMIEMPDYHHASREKWRTQSNEAWRRITAVADEALHWVCDERLPIDQRCDALSIVERFSAKVTADKLIKVIDLKDERGIHFSEIAHGRYPIVTVLKNYGVPVVEHVRYALANEAEAKRRKLLCDVLEHVLLGSEPAIEELTNYTTRDDWPIKQQENLKLAIEELQRRQTEK